MFSKINANKTLFTQILFVALAFAAMIILSHVFMSTIVRGSLVRNVDNVLDVAETRIASQLQKFETVIEDFSEEVRGMALRGDTADTLKDYVDNASKFTFLDGSETRGVQNFYVYFENLPGGSAFFHGGNQALAEAANPTDSDWYRLAIIAGDGIAETIPHRGGDEEMIYTYAKCIFDEEGQRLGVVCMDVRISDVGQEVVNTALNQGGYGMLLNQDLMVMFHPNADFVSTDINNPSLPVHIFADDLRSGNAIVEQPLISYKDEEAVAFFRQLSNGWYLGLVTPKEQYYASMNSMANILLVFGIVFAAALVYILIRIDAARAKSDDENRKKSMFLANMSHEIRTPINAIVGMTAIGRAAGLAERKDYCFSKIDSASKHLLGVINDILDISKIEANKIELSATNFNFEKMLQQVVNVISFRADEKHQKLTVHIDRAIPRILFADDQRLAQVITNLLSNAVKFTPEGGNISLKTFFMGEKNDVYTIKVEVADDGIGISQEQQAKLFKSFQQAEASTTRKYGGTGLGLTISKGIVELMGGEIWMKSEPGKGAMVSFTAKVKRGEDSRFELSRYGVNWENVRILAVDDDPDVLTYFQETIVSFGSNCDMADSAEAAMELIRQNGAYDIYFVDLRMPDIDGIDLTKEVRRMEQNHENSIVIMISSADLSAIEGEAKKAGVNKFLLKPLFPSSIGDAISECIGLVSDEKDDLPVNINGVFAEYRLLFVEDIEINREIVLALLEPTLAQIDCAENGAEAVRMFSESPEKYDMIFMDIQMPEMDGYEATRQIRALSCPKAATVPIVAMTANVFKGDIEQCLAAGMNGHIGKPLDLNDLLRELFRYLPVGQK